MPFASEDKGNKYMYHCDHEISNHCRQLENLGKNYFEYIEIYIHNSRVKDTQQKSATEMFLLSPQNVQK